MGIYLADQTLVFLQAILTGALLGLFFDFFRITRIAIPTGDSVVFVEDICFFIICAVATFLLLLSATDGMVRFFIVIGEGLGAIFYTVTLGRLVMSVSKTIIRVVEGILQFLLRWILRPVFRFLYRIVALLLRPFQFISKIIRKGLQKCKFRLKVRRIVVYNHFTGRLPVRTKKRGVKKTHEETKT